MIAFLQKRPYWDVLFNVALSSQQEHLLEGLVQRRCQGEPLSKIMGEREFWSLPFLVTLDTLDPRPDSETLIEAILTHFPDKTKPLRLADLGTGSGCLLLSALSEYQNAWGVGIDSSYPALKIAQKNANRLNLINRACFVASNWLEALQDFFDIIISNPPYIALHENLSPTVKDYDPPQALYGGKDGLQAYQVLLPSFKRVMKKETLAFVEIGKGQKKAVCQIATQNRLRLVRSYQDLVGIERVLVFH